MLRRSESRLSRLEERTHLSTRLRTDLIGRHIRSKSEEVPDLCVHIIGTKSQTEFSVSLVNRDWEWLFLTFLGHESLSSLEDANLVIEEIAEEDRVHFSGYYMLPRSRNKLPYLLRKVKSSGARVSFDPGWNLGGFNSADRADISCVLPFVDSLEPHETELLALTRLSTIGQGAKIIKGKHSRSTALKRGGEKTPLIQGGTILVRVITFPVRVVDSTGARDAFDAGFLSGTMPHNSVESSAGIGNAAARLRRLDFPV
jgi:sugar/nucleoside kinase (ribokinase family)